jgi:hypothetical protein
MRRTALSGVCVTVVGWPFSSWSGKSGAGLENGRDFGLRDGLTGIAL